jgi:hypothetical protein
MTTFPMMGVGVFNIMFWIGFVVGHNVGLACDAMLLNALLFGALGSYGVVRLERMHIGKAPRPTGRQKERRSEAAAASIKPALQS